MSRILVTGGSGFLGRQVVDAAIAAGNDVTVLDRVDHGGVPTLIGDITSTDLDLGSVAFDLVFHVAGLAHVVPRTPEESALFTRVNRDGTENVLHALERTGHTPGGVLLVSTVAVYGQESGTGIDEDHPRQAADPYGVSKAQAEDLLHDWGARHGIAPAVVRLPLLAGASAPGNFGAMIAAIRRGRYLNVAGGRARRSMVIAHEAAAAFQMIAERGGVFHLTDGHDPSFAELSAALAAAIGVGAPHNLPAIVARPMGFAGDLAGAVLRRRMPFDSRAYSKMTSSLTFTDRRAREELGWTSSRVVDNVELFVS